MPHNISLLIDELNQLEKEHNNLDQTINDYLNNSSNTADPLDQLSIQRLKKRKLLIKDRIAHIKSILYPDIVA